MLKITKGLKKKKKGKKSKHKEEELFKPEELEAYRRDHQHQTECASDSGDKSSTVGAENEEWKKFNALTSGVDDILKKTQGDLSRIKSTSFFQRVPPPSEVKKEEEKKKEEERAIEESQKEETASRLAVEAAIVEVSESESEEEEEDIFDTTYIDAIAAGEVKLAYIPESPTEKEDGDDPFDTSYAEKVILGPNVERKGKKLVPLGAAVEILTGRVQAPTCASIQRPSTRRKVFKEKDLLLGSFDDNANALETNDNKEYSDSNPKLSLLDEDAPLELSREPVDLSKSLVAVPSISNAAKEEGDISSDILKEFDVLPKSESPIEDDDEFALLAAESLAKSPVNVIKNLPTEAVSQSPKDSWNAFGEENTKSAIEDEDIECYEDDPFDTTFAENILPGQAELKLIEKEILDSEDNFDFNPRAGEDTYSKLIQSTVQIHLTNPSGERESVSSLDRVSEEDLVTIKPIHRDLLGGSSSDLTQLGDQPLVPNDTNQEEENLSYSDPFDTSIVDIITLPGSTELKFLEQELLGDIKKEELSDDDFDPRAGESSVIPPQNRKVSFDLPLEQKSDLLLLTGEDSKASKPLTPYYVREKSITESEDTDPFDTSFVSSIAPGEVELRLLENELLKADNKENTIEDSDFNPRDEKQVTLAKVVQVLNNINNPIVKEVKAEPIDLLGGDDNIQDIKVLTPAALDNSEEEITFEDPFDTSFAKNILPGQTELKLLESELISSETTIKRDLTDPDFNPRGSVDILENSNDGLYGIKPLSPTVDSTNFDLEDDFDPFDTSIANNVVPGPSELKLIESELI